MYYSNKFFKYMYNVIFYFNEAEQGMSIRHIAILDIQRKPAIEVHQ